FTKSPEARRKYLNMVLSQKNPEYLDNLTQYKRVLTQKNKLLQDVRAGKATPEGLTSWNDQLVDYGSKIIEERKKFINFLNQNLSEVYTNISKFHRTVEVVYETLSGETLEEIQVAFRAALERLAPRELAAATSLAGPHRDDFVLQSEGLYLVSFSS